MLKQKLLTRIETALTPKQAVLLWLQENKGKTSDEYSRWLLSHPRSASPRPKVEARVAEAIRSAMKGKEPNQISQAIRQGQMEADFLILLVNRTNSAIFDESQTRWLRIALLHERLRNAALSNDESDWAPAWTVSLRSLAVDVFSLQTACELIREEYFDGVGILLKDAIEDLERQARAVHQLINSFDRTVIDVGQPELAVACDPLRKTIAEQASTRAGYIVALAKSKMLDDFGEPEAADAAVRSYFLEGLNENRNDAQTT